MKKNYSTHDVTYHAKDECLHIGGWSHYCEFYEVKDKNGVVLAQIDEEDGTCVFPLNEENWYFQRSYRNQVIPLELLEVHEKFVLVRVFNLNKPVKRLYFTSGRKGK